jgi:glutamine cyclotransferase
MNSFAFFARAAALAAPLLCAFPVHAEGGIPIYRYVVKHAYPHDTTAFTEGLFFRDGQLYESTGQKGASSLRRVDLKTGRVLQKKDIPADFFGEGSTSLGDTIATLTWQSNVGFLFDARTFALKGRFNY